MNTARREPLLWLQLLGLAALPLEALLLILVLVYGALGSVSQALIVFAGIPLAVTGGVFALALAGLEQAANKFKGATNVVLLCGSNYDKATLAPLLAD